MSASRADKDNPRVLTEAGRIHLVEVAEACLTDEGIEVELTDHGKDNDG